MYKLIILSVILNLAQTSDVGDYLGRVRSVAFFPKLKLDYVEQCPWYDVSLTDVECTCSNDVGSTNAKLLAFKNVPHNATDAFIAISIVNTEAEALDLLTKYKICKCGENENLLQVFRPINEKFFIHNLKDPRDDNKPMYSVIISKYEETKADIENIIQSIDELKTTEYKLLCDYN